MHLASQLLGPSHLWTPVDPIPQLQAPLDLLPSTSSRLGRGRSAAREGLGLILLTLWSLLLVLQGSV